MGEKVVVYRYSNGPIRAVLTANENELQMFSARERNALLARSLEKSVAKWRAKYLKLRLQRTVLEPPFNYQGDKRTPLYQTGQLRDTIYNGILIARAPGGNVRCRIPLPAGHAITKEIDRVLREVPRGEIKQVSIWFAEFLAKGIADSSVTTIEKPNKGITITKRSFTVNQRRAFKVKKYTRKAG